MRVQGGVRIDDPAVAAPDHVDRTQHTSVVPDVEDIGVAVVQKNTVFATLLLLHEREHFGKSGFSFHFATERLNDGTVYRCLAQFFIVQGLFADRVFGFAVEPLSEVAADVADLHRIITLGVDHEIIFGDKRNRCRNYDCRDELEQVGPGCRCWCRQTIRENGGEALRPGFAIRIVASKPAGDYCQLMETVLRDANSGTYNGTQHVFRHDFLPLEHAVALSHLGQTDWFATAKNFLSISRSNLDIHP